MKIDRYLTDRSAEWGELEALLARAGPTGARLSPADFVRLAMLYRAAAGDLALARREFPGTAPEVRLRGLVGRAYGVVYGRAAREEGVAAFLSRTLWRSVYSIRSLVGLAGLLTVLGVTGGALWALHDPGSAAALVPGHVNPDTRGAYYGISVLGRGGLATEIFTHNILVACLTMLGGLTLGTVTAYLLAYNGVVIGALGVIEWRGGGFSNFLRLVVPHGLLELSCICLAGGAGFAVARALVDPGRRTRTEALSELGPVLTATTVGFATFLVVAGLTEGFITPWFLPTAAALTVGFALAGGFWGTVLWRGRGTPTPALAP